MPKISVIVPVYNVEPYLRLCVNSILNQTFTDFELLLIDDGSTDYSGEICDEYASMDSRVKVFHTTNRGVSAARNLGINKASAEWITFVDSDDWMEKGCLLDFVRNIPAREGVVFQSFFIDFASNPNKNRVDPSYIDISLKSPYIAQALIQYNVLYNRFVTAKLFNRDTIFKYSIHFDEDLSIGEDTVFVRTYLKYISEIRLSSLSAYHYMQRGITTLSVVNHSSENNILIFERLWESLLLLLDAFSIQNDIKNVDTLGALIYLINAFKNVDSRNYYSVFKYIRSKRDLLQKYYTPKNLSFFLLVHVFLNKWFPNRLLYVLVCLNRKLCCITR